MRITIDTDIQAIIVPDSYYMQVDKLNEVIEEAGGKPLDYTEYVRTCFEKAYATQIIRPGDVAKLKPRKKTNKGKQKEEPAKEEKPAEDKPAQTAEDENK